MAFRDLIQYANVWLEKELNVPFGFYKMSLISTRGLRLKKKMSVDILILFLVIFEKKFDSHRKEYHISD